VLCQLDLKIAWEIRETHQQRAVQKANPKKDEKEIGGAKRGRGNECARGRYLRYRAGVQYRGQGKRSREAGDVLGEGKLVLGIGLGKKGGV